jgi:AcrR family transcriptional regulator
MYYSTVMEKAQPPFYRPDNPAPRADAARNRAAVLAAAAELFAAHGAAPVSMDAIAARAGVGKPTIYRHFGDRAGLAHAVFEERERAFQEAIIRGTEAFSSENPPSERIAAFLNGFLQLVEDNLDVLLAAQTAHSGARFMSGAYGSYHRLLVLWLREAGVAERDQRYLADLLLAATAADLYRHQREREGFTPEQIRAEAVSFARRVVAAYSELHPASYYRLQTAKERRADAEEHRENDVDDEDANQG